MFTYYITLQCVYLNDVPIFILQSIKKYSIKLLCEQCNFIHIQRIATASMHCMYKIL